ncbi:3-deoxy-D-manno-octulosonic-acid transferase [Methylopila capsulata]|uniref:3-deoxy-D-manno-octulosonic acid transferase n=1 Tax=Methylopila capsulata TaxID=61654 RepID=A0A9W6ITU0_9HYPH|nr:3-deoxy-D-manno-octulosonic acid transferase [Methylopila capsulata]MBM7850814.1 3-deoxy-D-manno-octulosonic-acid transferase [Methylopila capsulata]GLK56108.1 3-deoxy-D-manno-octulosonic acid transferase [Methylopila capsulata]
MTDVLSSRQRSMADRIRLRVTAPLALYREGLKVARPFAGALLRRRAGAGKESVERLGERRGRAGVARPDGPLVWLHGASVGELVSLLPLIESLTRRGFWALVTTGTVTSAAVAAERLPEGAIHQFLPLDVPAYADRFLDHWKPDLVLIAESELWPNLLRRARRLGAPIGLVNARMSQRSFARWRRAPRTIGALLGHFDLCLAQSAGDAARFAELGARHVVDVGNLKFDSPPPPADPATLTALRRLVRGRPVFVAASTHPGEDAAVARAHAVARVRAPDLLTILAPRHPAAGAAAVEAASLQGVVAQIRSSGAEPDRESEFYIADTIGELGLFYRIADVVFMGGSLAPHGGQNPIEPAKLGAPVLHGPHVRNFADIYGALDAAHGAAEIDGPDALGAAAGDMLADPHARAAMGAAAEATCARLGGALNRTLQAIEPYLIQLRLGVG